MRRLVPALTALMLAVAACGGGTDAGSDATTAAPSPTTTAVQEPSTTAAPTTEAPTTSTAAPTTTAPAEPQALAAYFYIDEPGQAHRPGPFLVAVHREGPAEADPTVAALEALLVGPDQGEVESVPGLSTLIPDGAELLGVSIADGVATVDLSAAFAAGDDSTETAMRVAQVVFTATREGTATAVLIAQDGEPVPVPTSQGEVVDRPVTRDDYVDFQAMVSVESPTYGGTADNPMQVTGVAAAFEATFEYAVTDNEGLIIAEGFAMTDEGQGWGNFDFVIDYEVDTPQLGALIVWITSAEDGSRVNIREYPVHLVP